MSDGAGGRGTLPGEDGVVFTYTTWFYIHVYSRSDDGK